MRIQLFVGKSICSEMKRGKTKWLIVKILLLKLMITSYENGYLVGRKSKTFFYTNQNAMRPLLILLLIMQTLVCQAQNELHFNHLSIKEGLSEGSIRALLKDKEGYFWMGTVNGLVRYDGYSFKNYDLNGAVGPSKVVNRFYENRRNNIWIGTLNGFYFYNRATDSIENLSSLISKNAKSANSVTYFQDDRKGNIWIFFYPNDEPGVKKMALYNQDTKNVTLFGNKEKGWQHINELQFDNPFVDTQNKLWIETRDALFEYNPAKKIYKGHYFDTTSQTIHWFENEDTANHVNVWFRLESKISKDNDEVCEYNVITKKLKVFPQSTSGSANLFNHEGSGPDFIDSKNRIWFATINGLTLFDSSKNKFTDFDIKDKPDFSTGNSVRWICEDTHANFWCWLVGGLAYFNTATGSYTVYKSNWNDATDGIIDNLSHISLDNYGLPWFGVEQEGLQWVNKNRSSFVLYNNNPNRLHSFAGGATFCFAETMNGNFWVGSHHGLYYWQKQLDSFTYIHFEKKVTDVDVNTVMQAKDGNVWFSAYGQQNNVSGLYCYNPISKQIKNYRHKNNDSLSLPESNVTNIVQDNAGKIWIGTYGNGICGFNADTQNFTRYPFIKNDATIIPANNTLDDQRVVAMCIDTGGILWLGTNAGGLNKFVPKTNTFTSYLNKIPDFFSVVSLYDDENAIWAGTYESGLFSVNKKTNAIKKYSEANGLLYNGCWGIQKDNHNNMWVVSPRGFSIVNINTGNVNHINATDGLPAEPYFSSNELYKTKEGTFLYGCKDGFVSFNPDDFTTDTTVPIMHIETVSFNEPQKNSNKDKDSSIVRWGKDNINLRYNENRVTFSYVGLLYQNTSSVQYACKLDGYDKGWIAAGTQRTATYTNLFPGTYTFHVKAANSDGVWATREDSIMVIISPPWWKTWWAYLLYAFVFIIAVSSFIAYRSRNLKRQNLLLEQKVTNRTDQLNQKTEELNQSFEELKSTQAQLIQSEKMASLGELTAGIAHEIQNPLNFVNNFSELNKELLEELKEEIDKGNMNEVKTIANDVIENEVKINHHGKRADAIVKGMLQHSRKNNGVKENIDINALCDEYVRLSYHGLRAKDKNFNADFKTYFDESIGKINIVPQDMGRVLLNLFNNAFYAVNEKKKTADKNYKPLVTVATKSPSPPVKKGWVEVIVTDNGNGIPQKIIDKIFQPFFTTKPTGEGTGLGLSLSYDIITKEHNGTIKVESEEGEGSTFIIQIPS